MVKALRLIGYYPFGMVMPGRTYSAGSSYRYGFNGMEKDDEVKGAGNSYTTEFRQYDPRIGRWLSVDPLAKQNSYQSPYVGYDDNPIYYIDPAGADSEDPKEKVNVYVVAKTRKKQDGTDDGAMNSSLKSAKNANVQIFEVDNVEDFVKQLGDWKKNNTEKEIGNLIFDSHGAYEQARFRIGSEIVNSSTLRLLRDVKPLLDDNTTVTVLACHSGGGANDAGVGFIQKVSNALGKPVLANKSWSPSGDIFEDYGLGIVGPKYQYSSNFTGEDKEKKSPAAVANLGIWITARPAKSGKLNVVQHNAIYLDDDGDYHISGKNFNMRYWGDEQTRNEFIKKHNLQFTKID